MKKYTVTVPFSGHLTMTIEAESKDAAIDKALSSEFEHNIVGGEAVEIAEFQLMEKVNDGDICYFPAPWKVEVWEVEVEEET